MSLIAQKTPEDLVQYISCAEVDIITLRTGTFFKNININCPTTAKVRRLVLAELENFMEMRRSYPDNTSDKFQIAAFWNKQPVMGAKWVTMDVTDDKEFNRKSGGILVFMGFTITSDVEKK